MARADFSRRTHHKICVLNFNKLLKNVQGVDYAETIMQLKNEESLYLSHSIICWGKNSPAIFEVNFSCDRMMIYWCVY